MINNSPYNPQNPKTSLYRFIADKNLQNQSAIDFRTGLVLSDQAGIIAQLKCFEVAGNEIYARVALSVVGNANKILATNFSCKYDGFYKQDFNNKRPLL